MLKLTHAMFIELNRVTISLTRKLTKPGAILCSLMNFIQPDNRESTQIQIACT